MKRKTLPALLAAAVLAFALAGCSSAQSMTEDTLKGTWALDSSSSVGFDAYAMFDDEGVAELMVADSDLTGTWSVSGTEGTLTLYSYDASMFMTEDEDQEVQAEEKTAKMTYSGGKLTIGSSDGSKLVFSKDDSEEVKGMFSSSDFDSDIELVDPVVNEVEPVTIVDDDQLTIKVMASGSDEYGDPGYQLSVTNKTDKNIDIENAEDFTVGGTASEYAFVNDYVEAGETIETWLTFSEDEISGDAPAAVDGTIIVYDDDALTAAYEALDEEDDEAEPDLSAAEIARYPFHMD